MISQGTQFIPQKVICCGLILNFLWNKYYEFETMLHLYNNTSTTTTPKKTKNNQDVILPITVTLVDVLALPNWLVAVHVYTPLCSGWMDWNISNFESTSCFTCASGMFWWPFLLHVSLGLGIPLAWQESTARVPFTKSLIDGRLSMVGLSIKQQGQN